MFLQLCLLKSYTTKEHNFFFLFKPMQSLLNPSTFNILCKHGIIESLSLEKPPRSLSTAIKQYDPNENLVLPSEATTTAGV